MAIRLNHNKKSTALAVTILLLCSLVAWHSIKELNAAEKSVYQISKTSIHQSNNYSLYDQQACVGTLTTTPQASNDSLIVNFKGYLQTTIDHSLVTLNLQGFFQLNVLQQIVGMQAELIGPQTGFSVKLSGLKDIVLTVSTTQPKKLILAHNFAGPLVLSDTSQLFYSIKLANQPINFEYQQQTKFLAETQANRLSIKNTSCDINLSNSLNLDQYLKLARKFIPTVN